MATTVGAAPLVSRTDGREDHIRVVGPAPGGGVRVSITGRELFRRIDLLPDRLARMTELADGGVARSRGLISPLTLVADSSLTRAVLTRPDGLGQGPAFDALAVTLGRGLLTSNGELHRRQRRLVQPAFHARRLGIYARDAVALADARSTSWRDGQIVDLAAEMSSLTLQVVGRTLFGADVRGEVAVVSAAMQDLMADFPTLLTLRGMAMLRLPTPLRRRVLGRVAELDGVVERVVAARRASGDTGDVVSMLLAATDEETGEAMPPRQIRDEVLTLLTAGHETTAVALSWAFLTLARSPSARELLEEELASPQGQHALDDGAWERLPVTRAVVAETLRLYPPAHLIARRATEDLELGGYHFRRGEGVLVAPFALHRDHRWWGSDAAEFRPGRWLDGQGVFDESAPGQPRGAYLPFGAGSRMCIGAGFAVLEAVLLLGRLASTWSIEIDPSFTPRPHPAVTLRTGPLPATLRRRASTPAG